MTTSAVPKASWRYLRLNCAICRNSIASCSQLLPLHFPTVHLRDHLQPETQTTKLLDNHPPRFKFNPPIELRHTLYTNHKQKISKALRQIPPWRRFQSRGGPTIIAPEQRSWSLIAKGRTSQGAEFNTVLHIRHTVLCRNAIGRSCKEWSVPSTTCDTYLTQCFSCLR